MSTPDIKTAWMHPDTHRMLVECDLLDSDRAFPHLRDGRFCIVSALMPSTGIYDGPTPQIVNKLTDLAAKRHAEAV